MSTPRPSARQKTVLPGPIDKDARFDPVYIPGFFEIGWPLWAPLFLTELRQRNNLSHAAAVCGVTYSTVGRQCSENPTFGEAVKDVRQAWYDLLEELNETRAREGVLEPVFQGGKKVGEVRRHDASMARAALGANVEKYAKNATLGVELVPVVDARDHDKLRDPEIQDAVARLGALMSGQRALPPGALAKAIGRVTGATADPGSRDEPIDVTPTESTPR